ncbi:uncharacterized protein A4U43_C10F10550 [Asparagus officinalis]|uniref:Uncharacterized protein n=1 Tax=Asparagus officinalis TaxID=4686 RepID=A0A5P1E1W6_ASPOF|nr:uncharacterized protein A4U43_C10F10550 [Asparagus officinalis]
MRRLWKIVHYFGDTTTTDDNARPCTESTTIGEDDNEGDEEEENVKSSQARIRREWGKIIIYFFLFYELTMGLMVVEVLAMIAMSLAIESHRGAASSRPPASGNPTVGQPAAGHRLVEGVVIVRVGWYSVVDRPQTESK